MTSNLSGGLEARGDAEPPVLFERQGAIAHVVLNRAEKRNAINPETTRLLELAVLEVEDDPSLAIGVVSGRGAAFCSGADLNYVAERDGAKLSTPRGGFAGITRLPRQKPLIAAVHGFALAGGFEVALACDLIVAERSARFGLPEVQRGLIANGGGLLRLPRRIPQAVALDIVLTGRTLSAEEALHYGVISRVVDDGTAVSTALALARDIADCSPLAVRASLRVLRATSAVPDALWDLCAEAAHTVRASSQAVEGARSFVSRSSS